MNLIITAGGTRERIDSVRFITNESTGRLGSLIAKEFSCRLDSREDTIYYICGAGSVLPEINYGNIHIIHIEGTDQLQKEMHHLLTTKEIHAVIHSMAVSDYKVRCVTTLENIVEVIDSRKEGLTDLLADEDWKNAVVKAMGEQSLSMQQKISSSLEYPMLLLERTPKIIRRIKELSPNTKLVGFKLLSGVDEKVLIDTAFHLLQENQCDYVLANDLDTIRKGNHEGYLIDKNRNITKLIGKRRIASGIADQILNSEENRN